jgi:hypothetical protein
MLRSNHMASKAKFIFNLARISSENLAFINGMNAVSAETQDFGRLIHHSLEPNQSIDLEAIKKLIRQAANDLAIRFQDDSLEASLAERLAWLDYEYHTYMGNTYHWTRLKHLLFNRPVHENLGSLKRLFKRLVKRDTPFSQS